MKVTGPGKTEVRTNPESLKLFNFDIDGDALKPEHIVFLRREAIPRLRSGDGVSVLGFTDRKGSAADNRTLSDKRVARTIEFLKREAPGFKLNQKAGFGEEAAAKENEKDGTLDEDFRAVLLFFSTVPVVTNIKVIEVTAKSFIATIGSSVGTMPGFNVVISPPTPITPIPLPVPIPRQKLLETLAAATDAQFNEDPQNGAKNKGYRLFSSCRFTVVFEGGKILAATPSIPDLDTDVGTEPPTGGLQPPPLVVSPVTVSPKGDSFVTFTWTAKGRPHPGAEPPFQFVRQRSSIFIWHIVTGRIDISSGAPLTTVTLQGSKFPSHRLFVNNVPVPGSLVKQGPFSNLWDPDLGDKSKVK